MLETVRSPTMEVEGATNIRVAVRCRTPNEEDESKDVIVQVSSRGEAFTLTVAATHFFTATVTDVVGLCEHRLSRETRSELQATTTTDSTSYSP